MVAVNLALRVFVNDRGEKCEVTDMFDSEGNDTDDPNKVVCFVVEHTPVRYTVEYVSDYERIDIT